MNTQTAASLETEMYYSNDDALYIYIIIIMPILKKTHANDKQCTSKQQGQYGKRNEPKISRISIVEVKVL